MTIFKTEKDQIIISWKGWSQETPLILKKIFNWVLGACAMWVFSQDMLPFHIPDATKELITRWCVYIPAAYKFLIQWTHQKPNDDDNR